MAILVPVRIRLSVSLAVRVLTGRADEILLSSDKTIAVIDGSGVLSDPAGINRQELVRLAKLRMPVENFDKTKLSKDGYIVRVEDQDVKLPCM
jgi:glutamate dehydrogenase